jgi:hypothetical protein
MPAGPAQGGVVVLHGASAGTRAHPLYAHLADLLPPRGVAVLRYDRRGSDVPLGVQVGDATAALRVLRRFVAGPAGFWGWSQGGWVAALAADHADFLVVLAVPGVSPTAQMHFGTAEQLRRNGYSDIDELLALRTAYEDFQRGVRDRDDVQAVIDDAASRPWFPLAYVNRHLAEPTWPDMDFDPEPAFANVRCPVLAFYGDQDDWTPVEPSVRAWRRTAHVRIERLPGCGHEPTLADGSVSPRYTEALLDFLS